MRRRTTWLVFVCLLCALNAAAQSSSNSPKPEQQAAPVNDPTASDRAAAAREQRATVKNLPLRAQAANQLETLIPGASLGTSSGNFSANGNRPIYNEYVTEGALDTDPFRGSQELGQQAIMLTPAVLLPLGAIREIRILNNAEAEYSPSGAVVLTSINKGGDHLHGSGFEFFDNAVFAANNFYNNAFDRRRPAFRNNQLGMTLGGPVITDRNHFFSSYEGDREGVSVTYASRLPTAAEIQAATAELQANGKRVNPLGQTILSLYPFSLGSGPLSFSDLGHNNADTISVKTDHSFSSLSSLSFTYVFGHDNQLFPQGVLKLNGGSRFPEWQTQDYAHAQLAGVTYNSSLSPNTTQSAGIGFSRFSLSTDPADRNFNPENIGLITGADPTRDGGLPEIDIAPGLYEDLGGNSRMPRKRLSNVYHARDTFQMTRGADEWTFGGSITRLQENAFNDNVARGRLVFDGTQYGSSLTSSYAEASLIDLLAGLPAPEVTAIARGDTQRYLRQWRLGSFIADRHHFGSRLALTGGLRYDYFSVPEEIRGQEANFLPAAGLIQVGNPLLPHLYHPQRLDFSPRLAAALQIPRGFSLQGGYGIYFDAAPYEQYLDTNQPNTVLAGPLYNPIGAGAVFTVTPAAPIPFGPGVPIFGSAAPQPPFDIFATNMNVRDPLVHNYNLGITRQLGKDANFRIGYFGSAGRRLPVVIDVNAPTPGPAGAAQEQARRPFNQQFPGYRAIDTMTDVSFSNYNSLQAQVEVRAYRNLSLKANYTWSRWLDLNTSASGTKSGYPEDPRDPHRDYGLSDFDIPQRFTVTFSYAVPAPARLRGSLVGSFLTGWEMNGIGTVQAGQPINITISSDNSGTGIFEDRPNLVGNPFVPFNPTGPYLNPAAFQLPPQGTYGNLGRNAFRAPGLSNIDYSLVKVINVDSERRLRLRGEFFNLLNHPNFANPSTTFGSGYRLTSTPDATNPYFGAGGPRNVQVVAEFIF